MTFELKIFLSDFKFKSLECSCRLADVLFLAELSPLFQYFPVISSYLVSVNVIIYLIK